MLITQGPSEVDVYINDENVGTITGDNRRPKLFPLTDPTVDYIRLEINMEDLRRNDEENMATKLRRKSMAGIFTKFFIFMNSSKKRFSVCQY